jgi:uncharacterized protein (DUF1330 family)
MSVYLVNSYNIHDMDTFKNYPPGVAPLLARYGAKLLAMEMNAETLEGKAKTMNAIIEFPSEETIHTMYNDPDYQAIIHLRHNSTSDCTMTILKAFKQ